MEFTNSDAWKEKDAGGVNNVESLVSGKCICRCCFEGEEGNDLVSLSVFGFGDGEGRD